MVSTRRFSTLGKIAWHLSGAGGAAVLSAYAVLRARLTPQTRRNPREVHILTEGHPRRGLSPAARYRAFQYLPLLEARGFVCRVRPSRPNKYFLVRPWFRWLEARMKPLSRALAAAQFGRQILGRTLDYAGAARAGVVFLQRDLVALPKSRLETLLPLFNRHIVFDFDDAIFRCPSWSSAEERTYFDAAQREKIQAICKLSVAVIVGNAWLADWVRPLNPNVHVVPTMLDTEEFRPPAKRVPNDVPVIGWVGTSGNLFYLRAIAGALRALAKRRDFVLRVICDRVDDEALNGLPSVDFVVWSADNEVARIQDFDIGIMPLTDDDWSRGKAGFKLIQYMACGVPIVWSPVGANTEVAGPDGECGIPARTDQAWVAALERLLDDAELRARLGACGRRRALECFDRRRGADQLAAILSQVANHGS